MPKAKKDAKYLNVYIERSLYDEFDEFCKKFGQTKTAATEFALRLYMNDMNNRMKGQNTDAGKNI